MYFRPNRSNGVPLLQLHVAPGTRLTRAAAQVSGGQDGSWGALKLMISGGVGGRGEAAHFWWEGRGS